MIPRPQNFFALSALLALAATLSRGADAAAPAGGAAAADQSSLQKSYADDVAAIVNDHIITFADWSKHCAPLQDQFNRINDQVLEQYPNDLQKARDEFNKQVHALSLEVLKSMVDRLLIIQEFENPADPQQKRQVPEAYLERQFEDHMTTDFNNDRELFLKKLAADGKSEQDYRREMREDDEFGFMVDQMSSSVTGLSPDRIKTYYEKNKEKFRVPDSVSVRQIALVPVADSPVADLAAKIVAEARQPNADFVALAKKYSSDPAARAGNVPAVMIAKDDRVPPEIQQAVFKLEPGQISDPVTTRNPTTNQTVIFIFKCEAKTAAGILPLDKVQTAIENELAQEDLAQAREKWLERLRAKAYIYPPGLFSKS
jgi:parvulin-like peptidyl-prolyl isomerase